MIEEWKSIKNFDRYEISNLGNVRKVLKGYINADGYISIGLTDNNGNRQTKRIHRIVCDTFIPKEIGKEIINHKDGIRDNNELLNLEWCTPQENTLHAIKSGSWDSSKIFHQLSKEEKNDIFNMLNNGHRVKDVSEKYNNITTSSIHYILENDFKIYDTRKFITQARFKHSIEERTRKKKEIILSGKTNKMLSKKLELSEELIGRIKNETSWIDIIISEKKVENYSPTTGKSNEELVKIKSDIISSKLTASELAKKHKVNSKTIRNIIQGKTWKKVPIVP